MTEKVDIYGMGMIFYTLISGKTPFPKGERAEGMIMRGERPNIDPSWHEGYMQVSPQAKLLLVVSTPAEDCSGFRLAVGRRRCW